MPDRTTLQKDAMRESGSRRSRHPLPENFTRLEGAGAWCPRPRGLGK